MCTHRSHRKLDLLCFVSGPGRLILLVACASSSFTHRVARSSIVFHGKTSRRVAANSIILWWHLFSLASVVCVTAAATMIPLLAFLDVQLRRFRFAVQPWRQLLTPSMPGNRAPARRAVCDSSHTFDRSSMRKVALTFWAAGAFTPPSFDTELHNMTHGALRYSVRAPRSPPFEPILSSRMLSFFPLLFASFNGFTLIPVQSHHLTFSLAGKPVVPSIRADIPLVVCKLMMGQQYLRLPQPEETAISLHYP